MNPSIGLNKIIIRPTPVIKSKDVQLTDLLGREVVVRDAYVVFTALFDTLKPVNGHNSLKHMTCE